MATRYKVPSQAASGKDSFSDDLVGFQITESSSLMTGTNFTIEKTIPEKDSKNFITQPFSNFLTLDDINEEKSKTTDGSTSTSDEGNIKFNSDKENADKSLYGSLKQRIGVTITNIISKYPAAILVDSSSPAGTSRLTAERITYDPITNTTEFLVQLSFLYNPFGIVLKQPQSSIIPETNNEIRNFFSSYTKYVIDLSGNTYNILTYTQANSDNKITLKVEGYCFVGFIGYYEDYLIRPNNGIVENFYDDLDDIERALLNRDSTPKFNAGFNIPRDVNDLGSSETITDYVNWPISKDGWNIQIVGLDYEYYLNEISTLAETVDNYKSNLIVRFLTSPQLYEFDTEEKKIEAVFQIYGQSFDKVKKFIDNIAYMRNVSYDGINNVPDVLLKNLSETLGLSSVNLFDEKALQDSLYTRHDQGYAGVTEGINLIEAEYEFYRRLLVNLAWLYKSKGTRTAIEFFLKFIGAPEPMIKLDEYVYKVEGTLPSTTVEDDIRNAIQSYKITNIVEYSYDAISLTDDHTNYDSREEGFTFLHVTNGTIEAPLAGILYQRTGDANAWQTTTYDNSMSGYTLTQLTGSTSLTRAEYPVDEITGLPRAIEYNDGSMFFQKGAGWYRRTLDHRSPDIIDTANSDLVSRVKVIKTKAKPFTYGEDYFDVLRKLPGLDYGYNLSSEIDNTKIEIFEDESTAKLTLNRKNINVFLSSDRAIDYDIYRKSRDLQLTFGSLTPQMTSGITFAEFLNDILDTIIHDSHVIKYKRSYIDMLQVYNTYQQSSGFTPYNYITVNDFVNRISPYWVDIIEQFIPATTLWTGGNLITNGLFNRSKFKHQQPCVPSTYTHDLYPDFTTVINEDLQTLLGGGTIGGVDNSANFRGLQLFGGLAFDMVLEVNGIVYSGSTDNLTPFSAFTSTAACTILTGITGSIPLICDYTQLLTTTDPATIENIKNEWIIGLTGFTHDLNLIFTGATGQTITMDFFLDTNNVEQVRFTIIPHEYYGCTGYETFQYYFVPSMMLSGSTGNEPGNCELEIAAIARSDTYTGVTACQLVANVDFNIQGVGDESGVAGQGSFYVRTGCTENSTNVSGCTHTISNVLETEQFDLIFADAANCEQRITFDGLQLVIINPEGYGPSYTGITGFPIVAYKPTYNYGIEWGTMIYSGSTQPITKEELQAAITGGSIVEVPVESIVSGSTILAVELKSYSDMTAQNFVDAPLSGYSFAYNYRLVTATDIDCLTTTKISVINETFNVLPTSKLLVYTDMDLDLNTISYHFDYKYPEDLFVKDTISGYTGDYLINELGYLTEVTGVTLNICSNDNYSTLYSQINFADSIDGSPNILFNGNSGTGNKIVVSFIDKEIDPLTFNLRQYYITDTIGEGSSINTDYYRDFTVVSGYTVCVASPLPSPSVSSTPGASVTPTPTLTPTVTPSLSPVSTVSPTPSITPTSSISATQTPSLSISATQTPSLSISATQTPTPSITPSATITPDLTQSVTPSMSETPSPTPSLSISATQTPSVSPTRTPSVSPTQTPSITPSAQEPNLINFNSISNDIGILGVSGPTGKTYSITFEYRIAAVVDNVWSNGQDPVSSTTYLYISTDSGSTWNEVDYITAEIFGYGPPDESDTKSRTGTITINGITGDTAGVSSVMFRAQYDCSSSTNYASGDAEVSIIGATITSGGGYVFVICNNKYLTGCAFATTLNCGGGVTPSVSPTATKTPGLTPSVSSSPLVPILIGFDTNGNISFTGLGTNIISLSVRGTAQACQSWINCNYPPEGTSEYVYTIGSQSLQGVAYESSATESNKDVCTNDIDTITFTNVTSGSTTTPVVYVNNDSVYCGDGWGTVTLELLSLIVTSGTGYVIIDEANDIYQFNSSVVPTPSPTPSLSISSTPTPSRSVSASPSRTPSITKTPSRTPSVTPASIFVQMYNDSLDNNIENVTIDGANVFNVEPAFPLYPSDNASARSPRTTGWYSLGVYLSGYGNAKYATLIDSAGGSYCVNIDAGATYFVFSSVYTSTSNALYLTLHSGGNCPSPSPSTSRTPSITPSLSISRTRTPSITPSRSVSASLSVSATRTPSLSISRTPSKSPIYSASLSPSTLNYLQDGNPYGGVDTTSLTVNSSWTSTIISDPDNIIPTYYPTLGTGSTNVTVAVYPGDGSPGTSTATIRFTCVTATADLTICRDGSSFTCI